MDHGTTSINMGGQTLEDCPRALIITSTRIGLCMGSGGFLRFRIEAKTIIKTVVLIAVYLLRHYKVLLQRQDNSFDLLAISFFLAGDLTCRFKVILLEFKVILLECFGGVRDASCSWDSRREWGPLLYKTVSRANLHPTSIATYLEGRGT